MWETSYTAALGLNSNQREIYFFSAGFQNVYDLSYMYQSFHHVKMLNLTAILEKHCFYKDIFLFI